jgi:hypothetical protein
MYEHALASLHAGALCTLAVTAAKSNQPLYEALIVATERPNLVHF